MSDGIHTANSANSAIDFDNPTDPPGGWQRRHTQEYVGSGGSQGHHWNGVPTLLLTTIGRRSGQARRTPLIYGRDGDDHLVVASAGGADDHPQWYVNLHADPRVRVQVGADTFNARARTATAAEKARLWPVMAAIWPDYDNYQTKTAREIPLVILARG